MVQDSSIKNHSSSLPEIDFNRIGYLYSLERMGLYDGPGVRTVFFIQGCPLKCLYCHNPGSQALYGGDPITVGEVVKMCKRYISYYEASKGGVTFSGGEPLVQDKFVLDCFRALKAEGIQTCIDTSGSALTPVLSDVFKYTDVMLLDIKAMERDAYKEMTGGNFDTFNKFYDRVLNEYEGRLWLRHVMVPGYTDNEESIDLIVEYCKPLVQKTERFQVLPYHTHAVAEYKNAGRAYGLEGVPPMDKIKAKEFEDRIIERLGLGTRMD